MQNICFILNSRSGTSPSRDLESKIRKFCDGRARIHVLNTSNRQQVDEALHEMRTDDYDLVVAGGGDGTVSAVAALTTGSRCALGVLPLGTLNHFAKDMGIPLELEPALDTLFTGHIVPVDVGEVNGKVFVNNSSLGLYAEMVQRRQAQQKRGRAKWPAFVEASLAVLKRHPFMTVHLRVDGKEVVRKTSFIFIGNNSYNISGADSGTRASLAEEKLSLYITHKQSRMGLVGLALKSLAGLLDRERDLDCMTPLEVTIRMHRKNVDVALDGEVVRLETPLQYQIRPKALKVVVPIKESS